MFRKNLIDEFQLELSFEDEIGYTEDEKDTIVDDIDGVERVSEHDEEGTLAGETTESGGQAGRGTAQESEPLRKEGARDRTAASKEEKHGRTASESDGSGDNEESSERLDEDTIDDGILVEALTKTKPPRYWIPKSPILIPASLDERLKANEKVIDLLILLELEKRTPNEEERHILSAYTGWSGISWSQAESVLTREKQETLHIELWGVDMGHRLPLNPTIDRQVVHRLTQKHMPEGSRILLACCDTPGLLCSLPPNILNNSLLTVHTQDDIAGRLLKHLSHNADVKCGRILDSEIVEDFYDCAFLLHAPQCEESYWHSNGEWGTAPGNLPEEVAGLECFLKSVRAGGLAYAQIPNKAFLDREMADRKHIPPEAQRERIHREYELITAFRSRELHQRDTQQDALLFQRREEGAEVKNPCPYRGMAGGSNEYIYNNHKTSVFSFIDENTEDFVEARLAEAPSITFTKSARYKGTSFSKEDIPLNGYGIIDGKIVKNLNGSLREVEFEFKEEQERLGELIQLISLTRDTITARVLPESDDYHRFQDELNESYDRFVEKFGNVTSSENMQYFRASPDGAVLASLEDPTGSESWKKSEIFDAPHQPPPPEKTVVDAEEALSESRQRFGKIDLDYIGKRIGKVSADAREALRGQIFRDPASEEFVAADSFLSGDIVEKVDRMKEALRQPVDPAHPEIHDDYEESMAALERVLPKPIPLEEAEFRIGEKWQPRDLVKEFCEQLFEDMRLEIEYEDKRWRVRKRGFAGSIANKELFAAGEYDGTDVLRIALNSGRLQIRVIVGQEEEISSDSEESESDETSKKTSESGNVGEATALLVNEKIALINHEFKKWISGSPERVERMEKAYNHARNRYAQAEVNTSVLKLEGLNPDFEPRDYQLRAAARGMVQDRLLLFHFPGAGKTWTATTVLRERMRIGKNNKALIVVPKNLLSQFKREMESYYPELRGNIDVLGAKELQKDAPGKTLARVASKHQAIVLCSYEAFQKIPLAQEDVVAPAAKMMEEVRQQLAESRDPGKIKTLTNQLKRAEEEHRKIVEKCKDLPPYNLLQFGFDFIAFDECDKLRNLKTPGPSGLSLQGNRLTSHTKRVMEVLEEKVPNLCVVMQTGTLKGRSDAEIYSYQRYLQDGALKAAGIENLTDWIKAYADIKPSISINLQGKISIKDTYSLVNAPELRNQLDMVLDVVTEDDVLDLQIPSYVGGNPQNIVSPRSSDQEVFYENILKRIQWCKERKVSPKEDNALKICSDSMLAAMDMRFIHSDSPPHVDGKIARILSNVVRVYKETESSKGVQIIFCDRFARHNEEGSVTFDFFDELRKSLIQVGVDPRKIGRVHDAKNLRSFEALLESVRNGETSVLLTTRSKLGRGVNIQDNIVAEHHIDIPWNPSELFQSMRRARRPGNRNKEIYSYFYLTEGSTETLVIENNRSKLASYNEFWRGTCGRRVDSLNETMEPSLVNMEADVLGGDDRIKRLGTVGYELGVLRSKAEMEGLQVTRRKYMLPVLEREVRESKEKAQTLEDDAERYAANKDKEDAIVIMGKVYKNSTEAGERILHIASTIPITEQGRSVKIGTIYGFPASIVNAFYGEGVLTLEGKSKSASINLTGKAPRFILPSVGARFRAFTGWAQAEKDKARRSEASISVLQEQMGRVNNYADEIKSLQTEHEALVSDLNENPPKMKRRPKSATTSAKSTEHQWDQFIDSLSQTLEESPDTVSAKPEMHKTLSSAEPASQPNEFSKGEDIECHPEPIESNNLVGVK